jgi:hypothetical protein
MRESSRVSAVHVQKVAEAQKIREAERTKAAQQEARERRSTVYAHQRDKSLASLLSGPDTAQPASVTLCRRETALKGAARLTASRPSRSASTARSDQPARTKDQPDSDRKETEAAEAGSLAKQTSAGRRAGGAGRPVSPQSTIPLLSARRLQSVDSSLSSSWRHELDEGNEEGSAGQDANAVPAEERPVRTADRIAGAQHSTSSASHQQDADISTRPASGWHHHAEHLGLGSMPAADAEVVLLPVDQPTSNTAATALSASQTPDSTPHGAAQQPRSETSNATMESPYPIAGHHVDETAPRAGHSLLTTLPVLDMLEQGDDSAPQDDAGAPVYSADEASGTPAFPQRRQPASHRTGARSAPAAQERPSSAAPHPHGSSSPVPADSRVLPGTSVPGLRDAKALWKAGGARVMKQNRLGRHKRFASEALAATIHRVERCACRPCWYDGALRTVPGRQGLRKHVALF